MKKLLIWRKKNKMKTKDCMRNWNILENKMKWVHKKKKKL